MVVNTSIDFVSSGTVTSPRGFHAGATYAGIKQKTEGALDLAILFSEVPCTTAAVFTGNRVKAAPILLCQQRLKNGSATAIVVNSGYANAFTGKSGLADAEAMARSAAEAIGVAAEDILVASTGVTGQPLPLQLIQAGIKQIALSPDGGHDFARAIMTTDTVPKEVALNADNPAFTIGGAAKGSGMIHPDLATLLCFLTTDASVETDFLRISLKKAVDASFNMVSIDGDTSPNDMVSIMANGLAGNEPIKAGSEAAEAFQQALEQICIYLAKRIARDGEGATKLIEVTVNSAASFDDARRAARTVVNSPLVKAAVHGNDPNWGRIIAAAGRSGAEVVESNTDLYLENICLLKTGNPQPYDESAAVECLKKDEVVISVNLNLGTATATAWGCDLSEEYVTINSEYTT